MAEKTGKGRATAAVGWGVLLGLTVMFAGCSGAAGPGAMSEDEPPIRVRGGSIQIDLLGGRFEFEEHGPKDKRNWRIKREPPRGRSEYTVAVYSTVCLKPAFLASRLEFVYDDGQVVEFVAGNATKIKASKNLVQSPNHRLEYTASGYIKEIRAAGANVCAFEKADTSLRVYLLD